MNSTTKIIAGVAVLALLFAAVGYAAVGYKGTTSSTENVVDSQYVTLSLGDAPENYTASFTFEDKLLYDTVNEAGTIAYYLPAGETTFASELVNVFLKAKNAGDTYALSADVTDIVYGESGTELQNVIKEATVTIYSDAAGTESITTIEGTGEVQNLYLKVTITENNKDTYGEDLTKAVADGPVKFTVVITATATA